MLKDQNLLALRAGLAPLVDKMYVYQSRLAEKGLHLWWAQKAFLQAFIKNDEDYLLHQKYKMEHLRSVLLAPLGTTDSKIDTDVFVSESLWLEERKKLIFSQNDVSNPKKYLSPVIAYRYAVWNLGSPSYSSMPPEAVYESMLNQDLHCNQNAIQMLMQDMPQKTTRQNIMDWVGIHLEQKLAHYQPHRLLVKSLDVGKFELAYQLPLRGCFSLLLSTRIDVKKKKGTIVGICSCSNLSVIDSRHYDPTQYSSHVQEGYVPLNFEDIVNWGYGEFVGREELAFVLHANLLLLEEVLPDVKKQLLLTISSLSLSSETI